jgi:hypothetical protein
MEEPKKIREKAIDKLIEKIKEERKLKPKISLMDFSSTFQPDCTPTRKEKVSSKIYYAVLKKLKILDKAFDLSVIKGEDSFKAALNYEPLLYNLIMNVLCRVRTDLNYYKRCGINYGSISEPPKYTSINILNSSEVVEITFVNEKKTKNCLRITDVELDILIENAVSGPKYVVGLLKKFKLYGKSVTPDIENEIKNELEKRLGFIKSKSGREKLIEEITFATAQLRREGKFSVGRLIKKIQRFYDVPQKRNTYVERCKKEKIVYNRKEKCFIDLEKNKPLI